MAGYRPPYTPKEEEKILRFIIDNEAYDTLRGITIWRDMEKSGQFERTYHSLKERFKKKIVYRLHKCHFPSIPERELRKIKLGYDSSASGSAQKRNRRCDRVMNKKKKKKKEVDLSVTPPSSPGSTTPDDFESATEDQD